MESEIESDEVKNPLKKIKTEKSKDDKKTLEVGEVVSDVENKESTEVTKLFNFSDDIDTSGYVKIFSDHIIKFRQAEIDPSNSYELMYAVTTIGSCVELQRGKNVKEALKILMDLIKEQMQKLGKKSDNFNYVKAENLTKQYQQAIFQLARNISADFFHVLYKEDELNFLCQFKLWCKGEEVQLSYFSKLLRDCKELPTIGENKIHTFFSEDTSGKNRAEKFINQAIFFIKKSSSFIENKKYDSAAMAIIGAGNCFRGCSFLFQKDEKEEKEGKDIFMKLRNIRNQLAHPNFLAKKDNHLENVLILHKKQEKTYLNDIVEQSKNIKRYKDLTLDIENIAYKSSEKEESPRAIEEEIYWNSVSKNKF